MRKLIALGIVALVPLMAAQAVAGGKPPDCDNPCMMEPSDGTDRNAPSATEQRNTDRRRADRDCDRPCMMEPSDGTGNDQRATEKRDAVRRDTSADAARQVAPASR